ncbi:hypothetical protein [Lacrimispora xylanisolvens]|uniref:hypothetical protein n=1 Tax=Lacrimispora xylanisolvens TaxID=384636 RepID=UPI002402AA9B
MFNILREMNTKTFELNGDIILATQLSRDIKGYVFIIVGNEDYSIPDVEFKEILDDLSKMNYLLIYKKDICLMILKRQYQPLKSRCNFLTSYIIVKKSTNLFYGTPGFRNL